MADDDRIYMIDDLPIHHAMVFFLLRYTLNYQRVMGRGLSTGHGDRPVKWIPLLGGAPKG